MVVPRFSISCAVFLAFLSAYLPCEDSSNSFGDEHLPQDSLATAAEQMAAIHIQEGPGHVYRLSKSEGEKNLHALAKQALKEDAWLYTPGYWIDIGYEEQNRNVFCTLDKVFSALDAGDAFGVFPENSSLIWYHIHPRTSYGTGVYPPNVEDILALVRLKDQFRERLNVNLSGKIFDGYGVWQFDLSADLSRKLCSYSRDKEREQQKNGSLRDVAALVSSPARKREVAWLSFYLNHETVARRELQSQTGKRDETISHYIAAMADLGVLLNYQDLD